ncbi:CNH domain-containing protein [Trichoderma barbatum]
MIMSQHDIQGFIDESAKYNDTVDLQMTRELLQSRASELVDLELDEDGHELLFTGKLGTSPANTAEITVFLFDHAILFARINKNDKREEIKVYHRPIPLKLLFLHKSKRDDTYTSHLKWLSFFKGCMKDSSTNRTDEDVWPISFHHLGKTGYELTLYASSRSDQEKLLEVVSTAHQRLHAHIAFFKPTIISSHFFSGSRKPNCAVPFDNGRRVLYGTDSGIYISNHEKHGSIPEKVLEARKITQIDILEEYRILLVLSNKTLQSYSLVNLDSPGFSVLQNPKTLQNKCSFFKAAVCMGKQLVACAKSGSLSTTIKIFEVSHAATTGESIAGGCNEVELFKEFYVPRETFSLHFLRSKLCLAGAQGFESVSLDTLEILPLLNEADTTLDFVRKKNPKPIYIQRLNKEFLLNYSEFSVFVDRNGMRAKPQLRLDWKGTPQSFALSSPWTFAFEPMFIELRDIETGEFHTVPRRNVRMLYGSSQEIIFISENEKGQQIVEYWPFEN